VLVFILNFIGCVPLATILGKATEDLATHTNATVGGLLNATFGNAVEIILSIAALRQGRLDVIRYTLVGKRSIEARVVECTRLTETDFIPSF